MILSRIQAAAAAGQKQLAVLIDPDKTSRDHIAELCRLAGEDLVDYFLWGGSLISESQTEYYLSFLKAHTDKPVILFPGNINQLYGQADALLLLSLISGRNPELLIGQHVVAAPRIKRLRLEPIPTGYILIDGGVPTSVAYMSNTVPIPANKPTIASCTALAGEQLGLKAIYLDAGSGAHRTVAPEVVRAVRAEVSLPLIVGGGIRTGESARSVLDAGADLLVVGNALETDTNRLPAIAEAVRLASKVALSA
jgi:putative glycerol-1-phosphate prenyltransferase